MSFSVTDSRIGVLGLGYVGLPLAVAFGSKIDTIGYDLDSTRIAELRQFKDRTGEADSEEISAAERLKFSDDEMDLADRNVFIVAVPSPIDLAKTPDLRAISSASEIIGRHLKFGDIVIYESTVYPGCTEDICVPILERHSGLTFNVDFYCGYSPERANPGDKKHRLANVIKITSGSTPDVAEFIDNLYGHIVSAGTHKAPSIKVAEAAKVIENTQRDLNIALMNEFAMIFNRMGIDTTSVIRAAETKWNFLPFKPGLVGGHCIGVDPYYLTHKAQEFGYHPDVILAGRRVNDGMGIYVANQTVRILIRKGINPVGAHALILGLSFKENCPDIRNTRVIDIVEELSCHGIDVEINDPLVDAQEAKREHGINLVLSPRLDFYDVIVLAVPHDYFVNIGAEGLRAYGKSTCVFFDVKSATPHDIVDASL